jgi:hypothetical protein
LKCQKSQGKSSLLPTEMSCDYRAYVLENLKIYFEVSVHLLVINREPVNCSAGMPTKFKIFKAE